MFCLVNVEIQKVGVRKREFTTAIHKQQFSDVTVLESSIYMFNSYG
jgi:hypothetical protein